MKKYESRTIDGDSLQIMRDNFRWFAGWPLRWKKVGSDRYRVTTLRGLWSQVAL